jgi:hypothetical protein
MALAHVVVRTGKESRMRLGANRAVAVLTAGCLAVATLLLTLANFGATGNVHLAIAATPAEATPTGGSVMVRFVNASPDSPALDFYVDGRLVSPDTALNTNTDWNPLAAGSHQIIAVTTGGGVDSSAATHNVSLEANQNYTVIAYGLFADLRIGEYRENTSPIAAGTARVRFINAQSSTTAFDIAVAGDGILFANVEHGRASSEAILDADTPMNLDLRPAGQTTVDLTLTGEAFGAGQTYDLVVSGQAFDNTLTVFSLATPVRAGTPSAENPTPFATTTPTMEATPITTGTPSP